MPSRSPSTLRDSPAAAFSPPTGDRSPAPGAEGAPGQQRQGRRTVRDVRMPVADAGARGHPPHLTGRRGTSACAARHTASGCTAMRC